MTPDTSEVPIACNLTEAEYALREEEVIANLFLGCEHIEELPDGYAFKFPGNEEWAARLVQFVLDERKCCPFFTFNLLFEPQEGPIWLQLRGNERVKLFVQETFLAAQPVAASNVQP